MSWIAVGLDHGTGNVTVGLVFFRRLRGGRGRRRFHEVKWLTVYKVNLPKPEQCLVDNPDSGTLYPIGQ